MVGWDLGTLMDNLIACIPDSPLRHNLGLLHEKGSPMPAVCSGPLTTGGAHTPVDPPPVVRGALHTADIGDNSSSSTSCESCSSIIQGVKKLSGRNFDSSPQGM
jgi:hypothetical protein